MDNDLQDGIKAYRARNRKLAYAIFTKITLREPQNEEAWLWLATASDNDSERIYCLQKAQEINPHNAQIQLAINKLQQRQSLPIQISPSAKRKFPYWILFLLVPIALVILIFQFLPISISLNLSQMTKTPMASNLQISPNFQNTKVVFPTLRPSASLLPTYTPLPTYTLQPTSAPIYIYITQPPQPTAYQPSYIVECPNSYQTQLHEYNLQFLQTNYENDTNYYNNQIQESIRHGDARLTLEIKREFDVVTANYENSVADENAWYDSLCN